MRKFLIQKPYFLQYDIFLNSIDEANGRGFLNIVNAFTDFYLFHRDNKITHIIHCCLEPIFQSRDRENEFYQKMAIMYQGVDVKNGKRKYMYKHITPELRKELMEYQNKLDLYNESRCNKNKND